MTDAARLTHRARAEHVGGTVVRYTCPRGHEWREDMGRKSLPVPKRLSESGVRWLAKWWKDGVTIKCPKCHD